MKITTHSFGVTRSGKPVSLFRMENSSGAVVEALDYGCIIRAIRVPDRQGRLVDVVLGYDTIEEYEQHDGYLGAIVGRYANRIGAAAFSLNNKTYHLAANDGPNHLHGGIVGFDKHTWDARAEAGKIIFNRCSPDGEEGYPGALYTRVSYGWSEDNVLTIGYSATSDADTVVNLTNHTYFNLSGGGTILDQKLQVDACKYLETQFGCLPTGRILPVQDTPFDFTTEKAIGKDLDADCEQLRCVGGYDHNFVLDNQGGKMALAATLYAPDTGIVMTCSTTLPGVQMYTSNCLSPRQGKDDHTYGPHSGLCLETQFFPDAPNHEEFPSPRLNKGETYQQETVYGFSVR